MATQIRLPSAAGQLLVMASRGRPYKYGVRGGIGPKEYGKGASGTIPLGRFSPEKFRFEVGLQASLKRRRPGHFEGDSRQNAQRYSALAGGFAVLAPLLNLR